MGLPWFTYKTCEISTIPVNSSIFDPSLVALTVRLAASREEGRGAAGSDTATESCRPRGLNHPGGMIRICYHP